MQESLSYRAANTCSHINHLNMYEVVFYCALNLNFSDDYRCQHLLSMESSIRGIPS